MSQSIEGQSNMVEIREADLRRWPGLRQCLGIVLALFVVAGTGPATAQDQPEHLHRTGLIEELGLRWGMSLDDVLGSNDFTLEYMGKGNGGDHYVAVAFPSVIHEVDQIILFFGFDDRLWRVAFIGVPEEDGSGVGTALFLRYDEWKAVLDEMYGPGKSYHRNTSPDVGRPDLILATLERGDAWHFTEYDHEDVHVQLGVKGTSMTFGHTAIYIKNPPMAVKVEADREAIERETNQTQSDPTPLTEPATE